MVIVLYDISILRRLENHRREFVANVSHELKTPLASIKAYAETLRLGAVNDPEHNVEFAARIEEQADRLHQLILDLLHLARVESGVETFDMREVPLEAVVGQRVAAFRERAETGQLQLQVEGSDEPLAVWADEEGLATILDNLLGNAVQYTPPGGRVTVRWRAEGESAILEVEDTGIGIAARDQQRRVRAVLPRGQGPLPRTGRHRPGPGHRQASNPGVRRRGRAPQRGRTGQHVQRAAAAGSVRRTAFCRRVRNSSGLIGALSMSALLRTSLAAVLGLALGYAAVVRAADDSAGSPVPDAFRHLPADATNLLLVSDPLPHLQTLLNSPQLRKMLTKGPLAEAIRATGEASALDPEIAWLAVQANQRYIPAEIALAAPDAALLQLDHTLRTCLFAALCRGARDCDDEAAKRDVPRLRSNSSPKPGSCVCRRWSSGSSSANRTSPNSASSCCGTG